MLRLFLGACVHCARICRVLGQPDGTILLLAVCGSGRQNLTRPSFFKCSSGCFQLEVAWLGQRKALKGVEKYLMRRGVGAQGAGRPRRRRAVRQEGRRRGHQQRAEWLELPNLYDNCA